MKSTQVGRQYHCVVEDIVPQKRVNMKRASDIKDLRWYMIMNMHEFENTVDRGVLQHWVLVPTFWRILKIRPLRDTSSNQHFSVLIERFAPSNPLSGGYALSFEKVC